MVLAFSLAKSSGKEEMLQLLICHFRRTPKRITIIIVRILREFMLTAYVPVP